jgi:glycosyltransferase involved in cell wall biosynthesis
MLNEGLSLSRAGFDVEALCVAPGSETARRTVHAAGFSTRWLRVWTRWLFHRLFGDATSNHAALAAVQYALSYTEYLVKAIWRALTSRADVYEAHDLPALPAALVAAKLRGRPIVYRAHELWSEASLGVPVPWFWRWLDRVLVPRCDLVVTPEENRSRIYREEFGARREPLTVMNCPPYRAVNESTLLRDALSDRGIAFSTVVLYQGLVDSMRCIEEMAEASRRFDDGIVLVIMGSGYGPWVDPVGRLAQYERIVVLPPVPYDDVPRYTASADMGILLYRNNCRNNFYCAPNKVFEYMMMGLPVIAPKFPGMLKLVSGEGVGLCVDPEDPAQIAEAVNRLSADRDARSRMRSSALRVSRERYNWDQESRSLIEAYRALVAGPEDEAISSRAAPP